MTRRIKKGIGITLVILFVLIIGCFWVFNEEFGEKKYSVAIAIIGHLRMKLNNVFVQFAGIKVN